MLVQISDLHVGAEGGPDPRRDTAAAVRAILELRPRPDAVLVSGDLVEHGRASEYRQVRDLLDELAMPVHVLAGNHDDRGALRDAFPLAGGREEPYEWSVRCGPLRVIGCDTSLPGRNPGDLPAERLAALRARLEAHPDEPTVVALHHPPLTVGIPVLDGIGLAPSATAALADVLAGFPQVRRVVAGHVHMALAGTVGGVGVLSCPSTWRSRLRLDLEATAFDIVEAPAGLLVHALAGDDLVSYVHPLG